MKMYEILTTVVVEDKIQDPDINDICKEIHDIIFGQDQIQISNLTTHHTLHKTIDYPDLTRPISLNDFDKWMSKSQIEIETRTKELSGSIL